MPTKVAQVLFVDALVKGLVRRVALAQTAFVIGTGRKADGTGCDQKFCLNHFTVLQRMQMISHGGSGHTGGIVRHGGHPFAIACTSAICTHLIGDARHSIGPVVGQAHVIGVRRAAVGMAGDDIDTAPVDW